MKRVPHKGVLNEFNTIEKVEDADYDHEIQSSRVVSIVSITKNGDVIAQFFAPPDEQLLDALDRARAALISAIETEKEQAH